MRTDMCCVWKKVMRMDLNISVYQLKWKEPEQKCHHHPCWSLINVPHNQQRPQFQESFQSINHFPKKRRTKLSWHRLLNDPQQIVSTDYTTQCLQNKNPISLCDAKWIWSNLWWIISSGWTKNISPIAKDRKCWVIILILWYCRISSVHF